MAGEKHSWLNTDGDWHPRVSELAEMWGFDRKWAWYWFRQISFCVFFETKWPQSCVEELAWRCLNAVVDKRGELPS